MLASANHRIAELESICTAGLDGEVARLKDAYDGLLQNGQSHIDHLEMKSESVAADFKRVEREFAQYRSSPLVRAAHKVSVLLCRESR